MLLFLQLAERKEREEKKREKKRRKEDKVKGKVRRRGQTNDRTMHNFRIFPSRGKASDEIARGSNH